ncbi:MAG: glycosyltransferase, partial [Casimicrobiaceae bacterium]
SFAANDVASINDTGTFRAALWGFDLNHIDPASRADVLRATLDALTATAAPQPSGAPVLSAKDLGPDGTTPVIDDKAPATGKAVGAGAAPAAPEGAPRVAARSFERVATVVIPALNEAKRIADVVAYALSDPATAEVVVIDDSSVDRTAELARAAGARVITSSLLGKGASMQDGVAAARNDLVAFLDGDLAGLRPGIITDLVRPLVEDQADFVKARFGRSGGRVTELTAKPMLKVFFPELAHLAQPLGGIIAARRTLLSCLAFEDGYGVDVGLLLGAREAGARITEVDIGSLEHDSQPLEDLTAMANEVSRVIYLHARRAGRFHIEQVGAMYEAQRQAASSIEHILMRRRGRRRLLLIDMDGTLVEGRFAEALAQATGRERELAEWLDRSPAQDAGADAQTRSAAIARLFRFVHQREFERVARALPLASGAIEFVNRMRRAGFMVGVVSDSYFVAAEIVRRRVFADFALAHVMQFENEIATGELTINPAFRPLDAAGTKEAIDKRHVIRRFREDETEPRLLETWAVGDNTNDAGMLREADVAFCMNPKDAALKQIPGIRLVRSFDELLAHVPEPYTRTDAVT